MRPGTPFDSNSFRKPRKGAIPPDVMNATDINIDEQSFNSFSMTDLTVFPLELETNRGVKSGSASVSESTKACR